MSNLYKPGFSTARSSGSSEPAKKHRRIFCHDVSQFAMVAQFWREAVAQFLTPKENIAVNFAFAWLGEERMNRTTAEYASIAARLPKLEALHAYVNERLKDWANAGFAPYEICHFKAGDQIAWSEDFPESLSLETIRKALTKFGLRTPRQRRR